MALVVVFGASGRQGLAQVRQLKLAGHDVRAISRREDPFLGEDFGEVEVRAADLYDEDSVYEAMVGADAAFYTHPLRARMDRVSLVASVGRAGKRANLKRVVWNTSGWIPDRPGDPYTYGANTVAINALWRTGVPATVFGSVLFMDNLLTNWAFPFIVNESRYVYPHNPDLECSWISLDDVAKFMIAAIDRPDLEGAWLNIGGPEILKPRVVAGHLSEAVGREIRYDPSTPAQFGRHLADAFGDEITEAEKQVLAKSIGDFYEYNNNSPTKPFRVDMGPVLERIPIQLETFRDWAKRQEWRLTNKPRPPAG
jgi:uncharacterized protein YbjT (DUF2867 family)